MNFAFKLSTQIVGERMVKRIKGKKRLQLDDFSELKKCYSGHHLWEIGYGGLGVQEILPMK